MNLINVKPNIKELFGRLEMGRIEDFPTRRGEEPLKKVNLFSDVQINDNVYVLVPPKKIDRTLKPDDLVEIVEPRLKAYGVVRGNRAYTKYRMYGAELKKAQ